MTSFLAKDDKLFVETLARGIDTGDMRAKMQCKVALQAFLMKPKREVAKKIQAFRAIQAVGVSTDFAKLVSDAFSVTIAEANFDLGYQGAFKTVPLGTGQDTWDIYDVQNGLTFHLVKEGGRIRVDELSGSLITCHVDYYGGAIGWTDQMIRYRKIAAMVDMATIFRNRFWSNKADNHYLLLATAAAGSVTGWRGAVADGQLRRDIQTINRAAFDLCDRCKDKGYGDTAAVQLIMYANPLDKARINAAFAAATQYMAAAQGPAVIVQWNIQVVYTFNANIVAGSPILVLPGNKLQAAEDMPPTTFVAPKDPLTLQEVQSVWSIYGAAVGDTDQCQQLTLG